MPELAYVNGLFCDPAAATVSIEDRGFQFADGVYEVIVAYGGQPFRLGEHLARLHRSLSLIDITLDRQRIDIEGVIREGIRRAGFAETLAYVQVTRGAQPRSHDYADNLEPTVVATFRPRPVIDPSVRAKGISVVTIEDVRWSRCEVKSIALLPNVLAKNRALRDGYDDAVFVARSGEVREATSANVFAVRSGALLTPVTDESILHGVTRRHVLECAEKADIPVREGPLMVSELESADEVFLSSTAVDVLPVTRVNGKPIGGGSQGPVTDLLYRKLLADLPRH